MLFLHSLAPPPRLLPPPDWLNYTAATNQKLPSPLAAAALLYPMSGIISHILPDRGTKYRIPGNPKCEPGCRAGGEHWWARMGRSPGVPLCCGATAQRAHTLRRPCSRRHHSHRFPHTLPTILLGLGPAALGGAGGHMRVPHQQGNPREPVPVSPGCTAYYTR
ncbi:hypothetical protein FKM82_028227 [Ascaphus truei]